MKKLMFVVVTSVLIFSPMSFSASKFPEVNQNKIYFETDDTFNFGFDEHILYQGSAELADKKMAEIANFLSDNPHRRVRVEGFADETGTTEYNYGLAAKRIDELAHRIILKCENTSSCSMRMHKVPYGELNILKDGHSDASWSTNRRVRVRILAE